MFTIHSFVYKYLFHACKVIKKQPNCLILHFFANQIALFYIFFADLTIKSHRFPFVLRYWFVTGSFQIRSDIVREAGSIEHGTKQNKPQMQVTTLFEQ